MGQGFDETHAGHPNVGLQGKRGEEDFSRTYRAVHKFTIRRLCVSQSYVYMMWIDGTCGKNRIQCQGQNEGRWKNFHFFLLPIPHSAEHGGGPGGRRGGGGGRGPRSGGGGRRQ